MARAKKIVQSPMLDVQIYQDGTMLYVTHAGCGPRAEMLLDRRAGGWQCSHCSVFPPLTAPLAKHSKIMVGSRRPAKDVRQFAATWLGVPEARVEVKIVR